MRFVMPFTLAPTGPPVWSSHMADPWTSSGLDVHLGWHPSTGRSGLAAAIRTAIRDGRWRPGAAVPSTRALAHDLGVARGTVTRVYADLAAEGYLRTAQGAPTRGATAGSPPQSAPRPAPPPPGPPRGPRARPPDPA